MSRDGGTGAYATACKCYKISATNALDYRVGAQVWISRFSNSIERIHNQGIKDSRSMNHTKYKTPPHTPMFMCI